MRLAGRRIVITGAGSGIGAAIARLFGAEGAKLALIDLDAERLSTVAGGLENSLALPCDVALGDQVQQAVDRAGATFGGLDGVVNVAGVDMIRDFESMTMAEWSRVMRVNLDGPMHVCKAALPALLESGRGTIVNTASAAGLMPLANRTAYCASKAGLIMFTKTLAMEFARQEIRANVICPGVIDTPMLRDSIENAKDPDEAYREIVGRPAVGRLGTVEDIAFAALYLTGDESLFTTGTVLAVDGGRSFH